MQNSYQLTKHPIGSIREFFSLSWPLMIGLISHTLMMFVDRLFLAHYDSMALNAASSSCLAYYAVIALPLGVVAIAEVLVGRQHGESNFTKIGSTVWSIGVLVCFAIPILWLIAAFAPPILFNGSGHEHYETVYFQILLYCAPIQLMQIVLASFFIAIGKVRIVTVAALLGNIVNVFLAYLFIFGGGVIPSMGIAGAAWATGVAQVVQLLALFILFLNAANRTQYSTHKFSLDFEKMLECLRIGLPSGLGQVMELTCHFLFLRMVLSVGPEQMTILSVVQSLYILISFITQAQSKTAGAIVSNLLGGKAFEFIPKVLRSALIMHSGFALLLFALTCLFPEVLLNLFIEPGDNAIPIDSALFSTFKISLLFMAGFFLFDGFSWIMVGFLTAAGDTRYILGVSLFVHSIAYLLPTVYFIYLHHGGADIAWSIVMGMSILCFGFYLTRYATGHYLNNYLQCENKSLST